MNHADALHELARQHHQDLLRDAEHARLVDAVQKGARSVSPRRGSAWVFTLVSQLLPSRCAWGTPEARA